MKKITTVLFFALMACTAFAAKPSLVGPINASSFELTKKALDEGADPNEIHAQATEFCWACITGRTDIILLLLEKGAKVDEVGYLGLTALAGIVEFPRTPAGIVAENAKINEKILKHFTVEKVKEKGWYIETDSTKFSTVEVRAKILLDAGANPNFLLGGAGVVKTGTPFLEAVKKGQLGMVKVMLDSKTVDIELRFDQYANKDEDWLKMVTNSKTMNWDKIPTGNTPLMYAVEKQKLELVKILVEGGAQLDNIKKVNGSNGHTFAYISALGIAIEKGNKEIAAYLLSKGASEQKR